MGEGTHEKWKAGRALTKGRQSNEPPRVIDLQDDLSRERYWLYSPGNEVSIELFHADPGV
jgi:hypothetical protein